MEMTATEFKAKCLRLIDHVGATGEEIVISKRGKAVARLVPAPPNQPWLELVGRGRFIGDAFEPTVSDDQISALQDE